MRGELEIADAIISGVAVETLAARAKALEVERDAIRRELEDMAGRETIVTLQPKAVDRYLAALERLSEVIAVDGEGETLSMVRGLIRSVTVHAHRGSDDLSIDFEGYLAQLVTSTTRRINGGIASSIPI